MLDISLEPTNSKLVAKLDKDESENEDDMDRHRYD